ncbi:MAG: hypothetical protein HJJLKODD_00919 [Phycisphaerae bacterium]|nr:hypothetical protein [Phycisphaerae bacterium]
MVYDIKPEEPTPPPPRLADEEAMLTGHKPRRTQPKTIAEDTHCVRCGYNLRGLPSNHRCPECGTAVQATLGRKGLGHLSAAWLKTVQLGLLLLLASVAASTAGMIAGMFMAGGWNALAGLISAGCWIVGLAMVTTPQASAVQAEHFYSLRRGLRIGAFTYLTGTLLTLSPLVGLALLVAEIGSVICMLASIGLTLGLAAYLKPLAIQMDDWDLERHLTTVVWGMMLAIGSCLLFGLLAWIMPGRSAGPSACIAVIAILALVFFSGWFMVLLYKFYNSFYWAAYYAKYERENL